MISCMGGWCRKRDSCGLHNTENREEPAERLCSDVELWQPINVKNMTERKTGYSAADLQPTVDLVHKFPGGSMSELAASIGKTANQMEKRMYRAAALGLVHKKQVARRVGWFPGPAEVEFLGGELMKLAQGVNGCTSLDSQFSKAWNHRFFDAQVKAERLFVVWDSGRKRYFATKAQQEAWNRAHPKGLKFNLPIRKLGTVSTGEGAKIGASKFQGEAIIPEGVKITRGPSTQFDVRYQVDPSKIIPGGFVEAGIGAYL